MCSRRLAVALYGRAQLQGSTGMGSKHLTSRKGLSALKQAVIASASVAMMGIATPAFADFDDALRAYTHQPNGQIDRSKVLEALDLWQKYATAGDVLSRQILGDIYSNQPLFLAAGTPRGTSAPLPEETGVISLDKVQALAWYTIAATHEFSDYSQEPDFRQINARARAQTRVPELKAVMTNDQVKRAQDLVVNILEQQSEFDLFRLGEMYRSGNGLPKNNIEALKYFRVAADRGRNANPSAVQAANFLITIMTEEEVKHANKLASEWQPPLPTAFEGRDPRIAALERQKEELQIRRIALAIDDIEQEFSDNNEHLIQGALASLGLYLGPIDGKNGQETRRAIARFQYNLVEKDENLTEEQKVDGMTGVLNPMQKVALIRDAAEFNHPQSQYILGLMYAEGIGVPVNGETAVGWLRRSAGHGFALSHYALGKYYREGIFGDDPISPSRSEAARHLGQAVALGYQPAKKDLSELYENGYQ